jgi:hypothetical protein
MVRAGKIETHCRCRIYTAKQSLREGERPLSRDEKTNKLLATQKEKSTQGKKEREQRKKKTKETAGMEEASKRKKQNSIVIMRQTV